MIPPFIPFSNNAGQTRTLHIPNLPCIIKRMLFAEDIRNALSEIGTMTHNILNRNNTHLKYPRTQSGLKPDAPSEQNKEASFGDRDAPKLELVEHSHAQDKDIEKKKHSNYEIGEHHQSRRHDGRTKQFETQQTMPQIFKGKLHINLDRPDRRKIRKH